MTAVSPAPQPSTATPGAEDLKVLHLVKGLGPGGAEHLLLATARSGVRPRRMDVAYLLPWKNHLVEPLASAGALTTCLAGARIYDPRWLIRLRRMVRDGGYDVVHLHSPVSGALARLMIRGTVRHRPAVVSTEHNSWSSHDQWTRRLNRLTFPVGDGWIAVSDEVVDSVPQRLRARIRTIIHGIDTARVAALSASRDEIRAELGLRPDEIAVFTVANLRTQKAYDVLLHAAVTATAADPRLRFFSIGQGQLEAELHGLHADLGLGTRFTFLGFRDDATRVLAAADLYVCASRFEGLPLAVMEALAMGLPIVTTDVGGMRMIVEDGVNGDLVAPDDATALADAVIMLARDSDRRARYGAASAKRSAEFDVARANREIFGVYTAAIA